MGEGREGLLYKFDEDRKFYQLGEDIFRTCDERIFRIVNGENLLEDCGKTVVRKTQVKFYAVIVISSAVIPLGWLVLFLLLPGKGGGGFDTLLFDTVLFIIYALIHSLTARDFFKKLTSALFGEKYNRSVYIIISGITLSLLLYNWNTISGHIWFISGIWYYIFYLLWGICLVGTAYSSKAFDFMEFVGIKGLICEIQGRKCPPPDFSLKGFYGYMRHPMYLFIIGLLWFDPQMSYGRLLFALLTTIYLLVGVPLEEKNLEDELGEEYILYKKNVPRWIPRLKPWRYRSSETGDREPASTYNENNQLARKL